MHDWFLQDKQVIFNPVYTLVPQYLTLLPHHFMESDVCMLLSIMCVHNVCVHLVRLFVEFLRTKKKAFSMKFSTFSIYTVIPKNHTGCFLYLASHGMSSLAHLDHLQLVPNLLKIFGTPSSVFLQLR